MITLFEFAELDSTSTYAQGLLDRAELEPPFGVRADRQVAGRGRRGALWESPAGNLYLTVALPPTAAADQALSPLKAALLTAEYVLSTAGVRLTVKWPNDLLFGGEKLGGFLLESSLRGQDPGATLVGIGLNLAHAPALPSPARAISLADITGSAPDAQTFALGLAQHLADHWTRTDAVGFLRDYEAFSLPRGAIWQSADDFRHLLREGGIDRDGALRLLPLTADQPLVRLTSIDHKLHWIYQGAHADAHPLLVADVGNTSTKLAFLSPAAAEKTAPALSFADGDDENLSAILKRYADALAAPGWPIQALSVNPRRLARLTELAESAGLRVVALEKRGIRRRGGQYPLAELGIDRLALIEAWLADHASSGRTGVLVSAGTATTIDVVGADGTHAGGLIASGLQTSLDALNKVTGLLPRVDARSANPAGTLGQGTRAAMANGALIAALGLVERVAEGVDGADLVLTGGLSGLLAPHLPGARFLPDLALRGAQILALGGVRGGRMCRA